MISVQIPQPFMNNPLPQYNPMSHPGFLNGMSTISKPIHQLDQKPKSQSPGGKRRPSRAGTRSVATLTAAQLERKRANDREAQRAIRQRTKDHIESLERRIAELTSTSDLSARLAQALQRNEELEQENKVLRARLNQAVTAMADGSPLTADILQNPSSPTRRLRIATRSSSVPTAPRSIPTSSIPQEWSHPPYTSPITTVERSPSLADVSPVSTTMRWPAHPSPALSDPGESQPPQYSYMLDQNRGISYSPAADGAMMQPYSTQPQMTPTLPSPAFTNYGPTTPNGCYATSPHEQEGMQMLGQPSPIEAQPIMYSMPTSGPEHQ